MKLRSHLQGISAALLPFATAAAQPALTPNGPPEAVERTAHATTWQITEPIANDVTGEVSVRPVQFVELADGLNWRDGSGAWQPTRPEFTRVPGGFAVTTGPHKVFLPDALEPDGVELITPDGLRLRSAPLCLSYFDPVSGKSVILAEAQTAFAEQVAPNEIAYAAVLASPAASVRYAYERGSFHQNLVLHEAPPPPESFGLSSASRLELLCEFSSDSPLPVKVARVIGGETDPLVRAQMVEPDLVDETLAFGEEFTLREGRAFRLGEVSENEPEVPVAKRFTLIDQRPILIEAVEHSRLKPWLDLLPPGRAAGQVNAADSATRMVSLGRRLPVAYATRGALRPLLAAARPRPGTGVVLDWEGLVSGASDVTLKSDMTYKVVGVTTLNGTTTLEGAVVKYVTGASIECFGPVVCKTDAARPCIFSAVDDDTVGQTLPGSTHNPTTSYYANPALKIRQGGTQLHDLRVAHAQLGLFFYDFSAGSDNAVTHAQFLRCGTALQFNGYGTFIQKFRVGNVLMNNVGTAFYGYSFQGTNEHLTLNGVTTLACDYNGGTYGTWSSLAFTNSLLVAVGSDYSGRVVTVKCDNDFNRRLTSPSGVFQTVAAGAHYLASSMYRNLGSPNLTPSLAAELRQLTTYPPVELTGTLANPTTLAPDITRDIDSPDLGYHYPALDRIFNNVTVTGTLMLNNGVAIGLRGTQGLQVGPSAQVTSEGGPLQMNRVVSCANVQEQWLATGGNTFMKLTSSTGYPKMDFWFTDLSVSQGRLGTILPGDNSRFESLSFQGCWLRGSYLWLYPISSSSVTVGLVNNVLERSDVTFGHYYYSQDTPFQVCLYNNLFAKGALTVNYGSGANNPVWQAHDNLFDNATVTASGGSWDTYINQSHNGFANYTTAPTGLRSTTDVPPSSGSIAFSFAPTVGDRRWYHASTDMINKGSRTAGVAGLYHYTVRPNNVREGAETPDKTVDIGYHYVAAANVALNQTATQSTTYGSAVAGLAVDGNTDGNFLNNSVTHTQSNAEAWWHVDLGAVRSIAWMNLWNRTDCCGDRLANFYVFVSDNPFQSTSVSATLQQAGVRAFYFAGPAATLTSFSVGQTGRYVRVQLTGQNYLSLAELQVFTGEAQDAAPFAIGVYGDLQCLASTGYGGSEARYNNAIDAIGNWISTDNLKVVLCSGDVVDLCYPGDQQAQDEEWRVASNAWKRLSNQCLVVIAPGNHEQFDPPNPDPRDYNYIKFNSNFGWIGPVSGQGDRYGTGMQTAYWRQTISGLPFLFLTIEYQDYTSQIASQVAWATNLIETQFPNDLVILVTHDYLNPNNTPEWGVGRSVPRGEYLWNNLVHPLPNVMMVLSGHWGPPGNTRMLPPWANSAGRIVNELYLNYQGCDTGCGCDPDCVSSWYRDGRTSAVARLIKVDPLKNRVTVKHRSFESASGTGFWLTDFEAPPGDFQPKQLSEGEFDFPLFE